MFTAPEHAPTISTPRNVFERKPGNQQLRPSGPITEWQPPQELQQQLEPSVPVQNETMMPYFWPKRCYRKPIWG